MEKSQSLLELESLIWENLKLRCCVQRKRSFLSFVKRNPETAVTIVTMNRNDVKIALNQPNIERFLQELVNVNIDIAKSNYNNNY